MRGYVGLLSVVLAACGGAQASGHRSIAIRMQGTSCRMACAAQLHPGEVLTDCVPPVEFEPTKRDPSTTVCFFGPAPAAAPVGSATLPPR